MKVRIVRLVSGRYQPQKKVCGLWVPLEYVEGCVDTEVGARRMIDEWQPSGSWGPQMTVCLIPSWSGRGKHENVRA